MTAKYKILTQFIKDISYETADIETYLFVKDNIDKYHLNININSKVLKNQIIEINTILKYEDPNSESKKSHFEITYTAIVSIVEKIDNKVDLEKIILISVPSDIYPKLEETFTLLLKNCGFPHLKIVKKPNFEKLYLERSN